MPDTFRKRLKDKNFTAFDNGIFRDTRISLKARGLLCTALSLPDDWEFSLRGLRGICKENLTAIQSALDELEEFGYLRRERRQARKSDGRFGGTDYIFIEIPGLEEQERDTCTQNMDRACIQNVDRACTRSPYTENVTQEINKQVINKQDIPPVSPKGERGKKKDKSVFLHEHEAYRCAKYLDGEICKRLPKKQPATEETLQSWAADFDKCRRIDGYDWTTIMNTLIFSQADDFWSCNILSGRKFRGKMVQLMAKMQGRGKGTPVIQPPHRVAERKGIREL